MKRTVNSVGHRQRWFNGNSLTVFPSDMSPLVVNTRTSTQLKPVATPVYTFDTPIRQIIASPHAETGKGKQGQLRRSSPMHTLWRANVGAKLLHSQPQCLVSGPWGQRRSCRSKLPSTSLRMRLNLRLSSPCNGRTLGTDTPSTSPYRLATHPSDML